MQDDESGVQKDNYHAKIYGVLSIMTVPILHFRHQLIRKVADLRIPLIDDNMSERDLRKAKNRQKWQEDSERTVGTKCTAPS